MVEAAFSEKINSKAIINLLKMIESDEKTNRDIMIEPYLVTSPTE